MRLRELRFESEIGAWRLWLWKPSPDLAPAVQTLWATEASTAAFRERVLPRESVELMLNLGAPQTLHTQKGDQVFRDAWVSGLQEGCLDISSPAPAQLVAASLHPAHAGPLLGLEGCEVGGQVLAMDDVLAAETREWVERMQLCRGVENRFRLLETLLRERLQRARRANPAASYGVDRILASGGRVSAKALQDELRCSGRYLEKQLAAHTGLTPKRLARLVRFSRVVESVRTGPPVDWTQLALACGFYDQSHFTHEFRRFTGTTPGEFLSLRDPSSQAMVVD